MMNKRALIQALNFQKKISKIVILNSQHHLDVLKQASFCIAAVPTPINEHNLPDLITINWCFNFNWKSFKKGDYVVYESTVYPGCTEDDCVPILEKLSGLKFKKDFKVGYSPERINPGDREHTDH